MDTPAPKHHVTATISEDVFQRMEKFREDSKIPTLPDRSKLIEDAILLYLETNKPKPL